MPLADLKPDQFLRNKTVVEQWRKVVVGGPWDIKHMMSGESFPGFILARKYKQASNFTIHSSSDFDKFSLNRFLTHFRFDFPNPDKKKSEKRMTKKRKFARKALSECQIYEKTPVAH